MPRWASLTLLAVVPLLAVSCSSVRGTQAASDRQAAADFVNSLSQSERSVSWYDDRRNVTHLPVVGLSDERIRNLQTRADDLKIVIDRGDWSINQLERAQAVALDRLREIGVQVLSAGLTTERGTSRVLVKVLAPDESPARRLIGELTAVQLGGVDPSAIVLDVGVMMTTGTG